MRRRRRRTCLVWHSPRDRVLCDHLVIRTGAGLVDPQQRSPAETRSGRAAKWVSSQGINPKVEDRRERDEMCTWFRWDSAKSSLSCSHGILSGMKSYAISDAEALLDRALRVCVMPQLLPRLVVPSSCV